MIATDPQPPQSAGIPVTLVSLPFYHSYGLSMFCFRAFGVPRTTIIMPRWDIKNTLKLIPKYAPRLHYMIFFLLPTPLSRWKVTELFLVPSMIHQLVNSPEWAKTDTSTVEVVGSGAAFLPPELRVKFQSELDSTFSHGYGSSESVRVLLISPGVLERFTCWRIPTVPRDYSNDAREFHPRIQTGR